jgi:hypothetical protein
MADALGEGSKAHGADGKNVISSSDFGGQDSGLQQAVNAHVIEHL